MLVNVSGRILKGFKIKRKQLSRGQSLSAFSLLCGLLASWWCLKEGGWGGVGVARLGQSARALGPDRAPVGLQ